MRRVEQIMGLPISIDIPGCQDQVVFDNVFDWFCKVDARFSTYKQTSEVSRYRRGEVKKPSRQLREVIEACKKAEVETSGHFSAWASDSFDPSGYVKGWAIEEASRLIKGRGHGTFCIGAGGDILAGSDSEKQWSIGIQDPADKDSVIGVIQGRNFAVATSGSYERGAHIIDPRTGRPAQELLAVTVTGPDIIKADVLATAGFVAGEKVMELIGSQPGYEVLSVDRDGQVRLSQGMRRLVQVP